MEQSRINELKNIARNIRLGTLEGVYNAKSGHPGGSLSIADILAYLYFEEMNIDPKNPTWDERDRFVLSKGHAAPALYATLAERGFFDKSELKNLRKISSFLQGHPDMKHTPGVDMSTGSLGQGISAACGMALAGKVSDKNYRVYTIVGDGESEEGQVWEASMFANRYALDNLCVILDYNGLQIDGKISEIVNPAPFDTKLAAFGYNVITIDAHDFTQIENALKAARECKGRSTAIIAKSVKGKGVSFMENDVDWHGKAPNEEQYEKAVAELKVSV